MSDAHIHDLNLKIDLDYDAVCAGEPASVHLVARVDSAARERAARAQPNLTVIFALDASGSMGGAPIEHVIRSVDKLITLLEPGSQVGVVSFSSEAREVSPLMPLDATSRATLRRRVQRLRAGGATNIEAALRVSASMFPKRALNERQIILLLTDGQPNRGVSDPEGFAALVTGWRPEISVATLGFGAHHNEDVLAAIAEAGGGDYSYISDPLECDFEFARALGAQGDVVAEGVELILTPEEGVEIAEVISHKRTRFSREGLVITAADVSEGRPIFMVARLDLEAPLEPQTWPLVEVTLRYRVAGEHEPRAFSMRASILTRHRVGSLVPWAYHRVLLAKAEGARAEARAAADRGQFESAASIIRAQIKAIEAAPGYVAGDGSDLSEALEQLIDEVMVYERQPSTEDYGAFRKMQLGTSMQSGGRHVSDFAPSSARSAQLSRDTAGAIPEAWLVDLTGRLAQRVLLDKPEISIGRTSSNDIVIPDSSLSKRHARLVCKGGMFIVADLKSTNATYVNGEILRSPVVLRHEDIIELGSGARFRYEVTPD